MSTVNDYAMREKVDKCLDTMKLVLGSNKSANFASADKVPHRYDDKYLLAEFLTTMSAACCWNALSYLGMSPEHQTVLCGWMNQKKKDVSLRFTRDETCTFIEEVEKDVEDPTRVETTSPFGMRTTKVITKVKEYVYHFKVTYSIDAFSGVGDTLEEYLTLRSRSAMQVIVVRSKSPPYKEHTHKSDDVNISWLVHALDASTGAFRFNIDRASADCFTPRQNPDVIKALAFYASFRQWCYKLSEYFLHSLFPVQITNDRLDKHKVPDVSLMTADKVFNPVVPLLQDGAAAGSSSSSRGEDEDLLLLTTATTGSDGGNDGNDTSNDIGSSSEVVVAVDALTAAEHSDSAIADPAVVNQLLVEESRSLQEVCTEMEAAYVSADGDVLDIITATEAKIVVAVQHMQKIALNYQHGVDFIEQMIRAQVVSAIGKEVSAADFGEYMVFHNRKLFRDEYRPKPFSFAVRRSVAHSPEGVVRIQLQSASSSASSTTAALPDPIYTVSRCTSVAAAAAADATSPEQLPAVPNMEFALNASTTVEFGGERHVHGWMAHRFSGQALPTLSLVAQTRQFSSYIVLIGRIASAKVFEPKYGFIAQNKDEFTIPLDLEQIPTAKEFKAAVESLSPEQRRFAQAFRSMQLESTLFAVCVVQIKPQLEKVLKLAPDSLTKEIKLTQQLMELFIEYQIPTDLLSYDESLAEADGSASGRLAAVKEHVSAIESMIAQAKQEEVDAANQQREYLYGSSASSNSDDDSDDEECEDVILNSVETAMYRGDTLDDIMDRSESLTNCAATFHKAANKTAQTSFFNTLFSSPALLSAPEEAPAAPPATAAAPAPTSVRSASKVKAKAKARNSASSSKPVVSTSAAKPTVTVAATTPKTSTIAQSAGNAPLVGQDTATQQDAAHEAPEAGQEQQQQQEQLVDFTKYPDMMDKMYETLDPDSSVRPTIIHPGKVWHKSSKKGLMSAATSQSLDMDAQTKEKDAAFDLLDALTRSGALPVEHASLHVIVAATHCFDQSLMDTLVKKNVNPIERVERTTLIMGSAVNSVPPGELLNADQLSRVELYSPQLF